LYEVGAVVRIVLIGGIVVVGFVGECLLVWFFVCLEWWLCLIGCLWTRVFGTGIAVEVFCCRVEGLNCIGNIRVREWNRMCEIGFCVFVVCWVW